MGDTWADGVMGKRTTASGDTRKSSYYSRTPLNPYPFGGLLGYWLEELRLKKKVFGGMG